MTCVVDACCSVIPYISVSGNKLLPLSVVRHAAGLPCDTILTQRQCTPTNDQCRYLNELCATAGLDFTFDATTLLIILADICALNVPTPYTRELPSSDPFSHAQYFDESLLAVSTSAPVCAQSSYNSFSTRDVLAARSICPVGYQPTNVLSPGQPSQVCACDILMDNTVLYFTHLPLRLYIRSVYCLFPLPAVSA